MPIVGEYVYDETKLMESDRIIFEVFVKELKLVMEDLAEANGKYIYRVNVYITSKDKKDVVATGRLIMKEDLCEIDAIAVLKNHRGNGYGDFALRMLIRKAFDHGYHMITLKSPVHSKQFFEKIGFVSSGPEFMNNGNLFVRMALREEDIIKECKNKKNF